MAQVLVVEQDALLQRLLVQVLRSDGHLVRALHAGDAVQDGPVDVAVVSSARPAVLQGLRDAGVPVLVVSASRASAGGSQVLVRPPARELLAAVRAAAGEHVLPLAG